MTSQAYNFWINSSRQALDEMEAAHRAVGGVGRGRRYATRELNHAYAVLLSARFQRYCRDLHSEAVDHLVFPAPTALQPVFRTILTQGRKLDAGNPNPGNIGSDFGRLGMDFWTKVKAHHMANPRRKEKLEQLNEWRNAVAHNDFNKPGLDPSPPLQLRHVKWWRSACHGMVRSIDREVRDHIQQLVGTAPW